MSVQILVVDEDGLIENDVGEIDYFDFEKFLTSIKDFKLHCLTFIDPIGNTYFNSKQVSEIKKELALIKNKPNLNQDIIKLLDEAAESASKDVHLYLKFLGE